MALSTDPPEVQLRSDAIAFRIQGLVGAAATALSADGAATDRLTCIGAATTMVRSPEFAAAALANRLLLAERSEHSSALSRVPYLHAQEAIEVELLNYHKDGTPFWVELSIVPVADESGYFTHWVSVQRDVTERKAAEELAIQARVTEAANAALEHRAFHDELTGLRNRAYLTDLVQSRLERLHDGDGNRFAVLFFDLDCFKVVNDGLWHRADDLMLIELAQRIESCIRPKDTLARMGGGEFLFQSPVFELEVPALLGRQLAKPVPSRSSPTF